MFTLFVAAPATATTKVPPSVTECGSWSLLSSPNISDGDNDLTGITAISDSDAWAVGWFQTLSGVINPIAMHWDGTLWTLSAPAVLGTGDNYFFATASSATNDVWAVGYRDAIGDVDATFIQHWDGTAWSVTKSPNEGTGDNRLFAVTAISATDAWAVGVRADPTGVNRTLTEHWDGAKWSVIGSPSVGAGDNTLLGIGAVSGTDVWAVGHRTQPTGTHQTLSEHWDGSSWRVVVNPSIPGGTSTLSAVAAISSTDVWAVGRRPSPTGSSHTLAEHWDGTSWRVVFTPNQVRYFNVLYGVVGLSPTDVVAVGESDQGNFRPTLAERWDGSAWAIVPAPRPTTGDNDLEAVAATLSGTLYAAGYDGADNHDRTLIEEYCGA